MDTNPNITVAALAAMKEAEAHIALAQESFRRAVSLTYRAGFEPAGIHCRAVSGTEAKLDSASSGITSARQQLDRYVQTFGDVD